jgi:hypothetical protein
MSWPADPTWFYQKGSGPLLDMGVYGLTRLTGVLGPAKRVTGNGRDHRPDPSSARRPVRREGDPVTETDNHVLLLDFGESTFATVDASFNVVGTKAPEMEVYGLEGTLLVNRPDATVLPGQLSLELFRIDAAPGLSGWVTPRTVGRSRLVDRFQALQNGRSSSSTCSTAWRPDSRLSRRRARPPRPGDHAGRQDRRPGGPHRHPGNDLPLLRSAIRHGARFLGSIAFDAFRASEGSRTEPICSRPNTADVAGRTALGPRPGRWWVERSSANGEAVIEVQLRPGVSGCVTVPLGCLTLGLVPLLMRQGEKHFYPPHGRGRH